MRSRNCPLPRIGVETGTFVKTKIASTEAVFQRILLLCRLSSTNERNNYPHAVGSVFDASKASFGLAIAPKLGFEHCRDAFLELGFVQSSNDLCLPTKVLAADFVDDIAIAAESQKEIEELIASLKRRGFDLEVEPDLTSYLGIVNTARRGNSMEVAGLANPLSAPLVALAADSEDEIFREHRNYRVVVGMLILVLILHRQSLMSPGFRTTQSSLMPSP